MADIRAIDPDFPLVNSNEHKTGKPRRITLNSAALAVVHRRLAQQPGDVWLFQSTSPRNRPRDPKPITRRSVARVFE